MQPRNLASHNVSVSVSMPIRLLMQIHDIIDRANQNGNVPVTVSSTIRMMIEQALAK